MGGEKKALTEKRSSNLGDVKGSEKDRTVVKTYTGATHSYSLEETHAFTNHINRTLAGDELLSDRLPLSADAEDIFKAVGDGLLLCRMINKVSEKEKERERGRNGEETAK